MKPSQTHIRMCSAALWSGADTWSDADEDEKDIIDTTGFEKLCGSANLGMEGIHPFLLAWSVRAEALGKLSREEFLRLSAKGVDTVNKLHKHVDSQLEHINADERAFNDFYGFLYGLCLEEGQRTMVIDVRCLPFPTFCFACLTSQSRWQMAKAVWSIVLAERSSIVRDFLAFLDAKSYKGVSVVSVCLPLVISTSLILL